MDRLHELGGAGKGDPEAIYIPGADGAETERTSELDSFFQQVTSVQVGIRQIETNTEGIKEKHSQILRSTSTVDSAKLNDELSIMMQNVQQCAEEVKAGLKAIDDSVKILIGNKDRPAELRIRENQHAQLSRRFVGAMKAYHRVQSDNKQRYNDTIVRRVKASSKAAGQTLTDEQAQELADQVLVEGKQDAIFQQARDTLIQIEENHRDILKIERSMNELHQIFADMAVLVEEQGELMDDVLVNVTKANEYVAKGRKELAQARGYAKKSRKKMFMIICCVIIIGVIIIVPAAVIPSLFATKK